MSATVQGPSSKQTWLWVLFAGLMVASLGIGIVAFTLFKKSGVTLPGLSGETITPIDLTAFYDTSGSWNNGSEWQEAPRGPTELGGVPFEVNGLLRLSGRSAKGDNKPYRDEVKGIPVGRKFARLHVLHIVSYTTSKELSPYARITLRHADGTTTSWPLRYGEHGRDWHRPKYENPSTLSDPNSKVVWRGAYTSGRTLRLFKTMFTNPKPDVEVASIDLASEHGSPNASILSLSTGPAHLPKTDPPSLPEPETTFDGEIQITALSATDGKPLPNVRLTASGSDAGGSYRAPDAVTDANGRCVVKHPGDTARNLTVVASGDGLAIQTIRWGSGTDTVIPTEHTLRVEKGVTIGGVVQDESGQPVRAVKLSLSAMGSPGGVRGPTPFSQVLLTNDDQGRWEFRSLPDNYGSFQITATHQDYVETRYLSDGADRAYIGGRVELEALRKTNAVFKLRKGLVVTGRVLTEQGAPIPGARLLLGDNRFVNNPIQGRTDEAGEFRMAGADLGSTHLTVQASGFSPECRSITVAPRMEPVEFRLGSGRVLKVKVVDESGRPVRTARISVDMWQNRQTLELSGSTDSKGQVTIESAPASEMSGSIYKSGYMSHGGIPLVADGQEHTFTLRRAATLSGTVVDVDTKEPIERFDVIPGQQMGGDEPYWHTYNVTKGANGAFSFKLDQQGYTALQIDADGYLPVTVSLATNAETQFEIELRKGSGPKGLVRTPDGQPAAGAQLAGLVQGKMLQVGTGRLVAHGDSGSRVVVTDTNGAFTLRFQANADRILATHPQGFADTSYSNFVSGGTITLQRWGRIEGLLRIGPRLGTNESVLLSSDSGLQFNFEDFKARTDEQGRFVMTNVPPGDRKLVRLIPIGDRSWGHSHVQNVTVKAGEVTTVTLGGDGRTVVGRLALSDPARTIDWQQSGHHSLSCYPKPPPFTGIGAYRTWERLPATVAAQKLARSYTLQMQADGTFRIEDVLAGEYDLRVHLIEGMNYQNQLGTLMTNVSIPEISNPVAAPPLDLGTFVVPLQASPQRSARR